MTENLEKPILEFVGSSQHTISIKWSIDCKDSENVSYKVQIKDAVHKWITKYWGFIKEATIVDLAREHIYAIRVGVVKTMAEEVWSDSLTAATELGPKWTYYMFKAIETSNSKLLQSFLNSRSRAIQSANPYGETALMVAARLGDIKCTKLLLNAESDPNSKMFTSLQTPLMAACFAGHVEVAELLVTCGANWLEKDICGRNALHYAVSNSQLETTMLAIDGGCDVNSRDNYNWTPLMRAGAGDQVLDELLARGGDIELRDENAQTCIDMARLYKHENIISLITTRDEEEINHGEEIQTCLEQLKMEENASKK